MQQVLIQCSFQCECLLARPMSTQKCVFVVLHCVVVELSLAWKLLFAEAAMPPGHTLATPDFICLFPDNFCLWLSWLSTRRFGGSGTSSGSVSDGWCDDCGVTTGNGDETEEDSGSEPEEEDTVLSKSMDWVHLFFQPGRTPLYLPAHIPCHC